MWFKTLLAALSRRNAAEPIQPAATTSSTHLLATEGGVPSYSQEEWGQFFTRHFTSSVFNKPGDSGTIDTPEFHRHKDNYVRQLRENVKGSPHIHVPFHDLPECRADSLSSHLQVKERVGSKHVSLLLARLTLKELLEALREDAGKERAVHIDFGRRPAEEESASHVGGSTRRRAGFFILTFENIANAMAHFGTLLPEIGNAGIRNIPGLRVTADLSGLKIVDPDELHHLHNLLLRSTIAGVHIDLSLIEANFQGEAWRNLAKLLSAATQNLRDLTLNVPTQDDGASSYAAYRLAGALCDSNCHLQSLTLVGGHWADEAKAQLTNAVKTRQEMGRPITVTVGGQQLVSPRS
jgi:hypothetical protein